MSDVHYEGERYLAATLDLYVFEMAGHAGSKQQILIRARLLLQIRFVLFFVLFFFFWFSLEPYGLWKRIVYLTKLLKSIYFQIRIF